MWRCQHAEGPIDDRWSFIKLSKDEETAELQILESRKESLNGSSSGHRIYYTTKFVFTPRKVHEINHTKDTDNAEGATTPAYTTPSSSFSGSSSNLVTTPGSGHLVHAPRVRTNFLHPTTTATRPRDPHNTHIGDDALTGLFFTFSKCPV